MAVTGFKTGTFNTTSASTILTLPTLDFTPNNILVSICTGGTDSSGGYVFACNETKYWRYVRGDGGEVSSANLSSISLGKTTKITASSSHKWCVGTYRYVAWREE